MERRLLDNKLKGCYERKKRGTDHDGDTGQTQSQNFKTENRYRYLDPKPSKPSFPREKTCRLEANHTDSVRRFTSKPNRCVSNTRTNLRSNTTNFLNTKEENTKKTSGLRSIINIVNQVQNVIFNKTESNYSIENLYEKPKKKKMLRAKKSDVETAVAGVKVSDVQIAESTVNRFKENCYNEETENKNNDGKNPKLELATFSNQISRTSTVKNQEMTTTNAQTLPSIQKRTDFIHKCLDTKNSNNNSVTRKPVLEKSKFRSKYTVMTEAKPGGKQEDQLKETSREEIKQTGYTGNQTNERATTKNESKKKLVINTVRTDKDNPKVYKAVTFEENKQKPLHLQIKIPQQTASKKSITAVPDVEPDKVPKNLNAIVQNAPKLIRGINKPYNKRKKMPSKRTAPVVRDDSPATEVAKWIPCSEHSQPYYEAWVDTSLAAVSNGAEEIYNKDIVETFIRLMEDRAPSPELLYEGMEEDKYLGKITIRTKNTGSK